MAAGVPIGPKGVDRDQPDDVSHVARPQVTPTAPHPNEPGDSSAGVFGLLQSAPAWLFSAAIHVSLLIILAAGFVVVQQKTAGPIVTDLNLTGQEVGELSSGSSDEAGAAHAAGSC